MELRNADTLGTLQVRMRVVEARVTTIAAVQQEHGLQLEAIRAAQDDQAQRLDTIANEMHQGFAQVGQALAELAFQLGQAPPAAPEA